MKNNAVDSPVWKKNNDKKEFYQENDVVRSMAKAWKLNTKNSVARFVSGIRGFWIKIDGTKRIKRIIPKLRELWVELDLANRIRGFVADIKYLCRTIDGMSVWAINRSFTKIALSREHLEEIMLNGNLVIQLAPKNKRELSDEMKKIEIEEKIKELEGFAILRLSLLEDCVPVYKETLTEFGVARWLEVPLEIA